MKRHNNKQTDNEKLAYAIKQAKKVYVTVKLSPHHVALLRITKVQALYLADQFVGIDWFVGSDTNNVYIG